MDFGDPLGVSPPKGEKICTGPICNIMQTFTPIGATVAEISVTKQERSYRKQIARQLRTQYVEGIYNPVTLKSNLRVTGNGTIG